MMESKFSTTLKSARARFTASSDHVRARLAGRRKQVMGIAALAAIAGTGIGAASLAHPTDPTAVVASSNGANLDDRQNAAARANRAARAQTTTSPSGKVTPTPAKPKNTKRPAPKYVTPMAGAQVTSCYGQRWGVLHAGVDFAARENTPIRAVQAGTVYSSGWAYSGYGISVVVNHGNGTFTHYAHMNKAAVRVGQKVSAGTVLGYEGSTGDSTGPHLHFEVHKGMWHQVNPAGWLASRGIRTQC